MKWNWNNKKKNWKSTCKAILKKKKKNLLEVLITAIMYVGVLARALIMTEKLKSSTSVNEIIAIKLLKMTNEFDSCEVLLLALAFC